jgi:hypothetical protein
MSRIETQLEHQKETIDRLQTAVASFETIRREVHHHAIILKALTWVTGLAVAFFTTKFLGRVLG